MRTFSKAKLNPLAKTKAAIAAALFFVPFAAPFVTTQAFAQTPWLPTPGATDLTVSYTNQKADKLKAGTASGDLPVTLKQDTVSLVLNHGLSDSLAIDVAVGYAKSKFIQVPGLAPDGGLSGVTDSRLGLRFRLLDDQASDPVTLTFGAAAILKGNYKTGALPAIGDGANALEISAAVGKAITSNVSVYGVVGYRDRKAPVPNETFFKVGVNANFTPQLFAGLDYQKVDARGGLDIGGPGFSPARFPEVQEDYSLTSATLGYRFNKSLSAAVQYGDKQGQRNTAVGKVVGISLNTSF
jgi:hypothetical protein